MTASAFRRLLPLACALALALAGCGKRETPVQRGIREQVLLVGAGAGLSDLDPQLATSVGEFNVLLAFFEGLTDLDPATLDPVPSVAQKWETSPDARTWTFHLNPAARWSDGTPTTAQDFVVSWHRLLTPALGADYASLLYCVVGAEDFNRGRLTDFAQVGVSAPAPHTLVLRLRHPTPHLPALLALPPLFPVPLHVIERCGPADQRGNPWTRPATFVGNGPFLLTRWTPNQTIEVRRNPLYWDASRVRLSGVNFFAIDTASVQEQGFRAGEFHIALKFPLYKAAAYENAQPTALHRYPVQETHFLTFNVTQAPFTDARVRRALSMAIDRQRLCTAIFHALAEPAFTQVRPGTGGYAPPDEASYHFNPEAARRLLAEAGYPQGRGFPPVELMLVGNEPQTVALGEVVQAAWKDVLGISTQLLPTEKKVYLDDERTKHFQVVNERWEYAWDDPSAYYQTGQSGNPNNDSGWSDPEFDRAYHEAEISLDGHTRTAAFDRQEERMAASVPYAPLYFYNKPVLIAPSVRGWSGNRQDHLEWKEIWLEH